MDISYKTTKGIKHGNHCKYCIDKAKGEDAGMILFSRHIVINESLDSYLLEHEQLTNNHCHQIRIHTRKAEKLKSYFSVISN